MPAGRIFLAENPECGKPVENIRYNYTPAVVISESMLNCLDSYNNKTDGEKGFTKFRTDVGEGLSKSSTYVKGAAIVLTFTVGPEAGVPLYEAGAYLETTANVVKGINAAADGQFVNAGLEFGSILLGRGYGKASKELGDFGADKVQQFGANALSDILLDKTKDALKTPVPSSTDKK